MARKENPIQYLWGPARSFCRTIKSMEQEHICVILTQVSPNLSEHVKHDGKMIKFELTLKYISIVAIVIGCLYSCHLLMISPFADLKKQCCYRLLKISLTGFLKLINISSTLIMQYTLRSFRWMKQPTSTWLLEIVTSVNVPMVAGWRRDSTNK